MIHVEGIKLRRGGIFFYNIRERKRTRRRRRERRRREGRREGEEVNEGRGCD